ncbi:hypothetical protein BKA70DRAFT_515640 [Coprinopsis sp. MPI-PUGE-AT-0042]|nr:hypothetical protein BKA70DRAFT_515640 [Coprinopsis sp. MPI-PUGE-AT-0042]
MLKHEDATSLVSLTRKSILWQVAGSSLVLWDHVTTFDQEIEFIWHRKWSSTAFLFILTRYAGDMMFIHGAISVLATGKFLDKVSPSVVQVQSWLAQIALLSMNGIVVKRVVCMYRGDRRVVWALTVALAAFTVHSTTVMILISNVRSVVRRIQSVYLYETCHVWLIDTIPWWYWTFIISMVIFDALVFGLSLLQGISFACANRRMQRDGRKVGILGHLWRTRRTLASVLLRDSILFPFINLIVAMFLILLWRAKLSPDAADLLSVVAGATVPTLGCRLLLHLRSAYYRPFREEYCQSQFQDRSSVLPDWSIESTRS